MILPTYQGVALSITRFRQIQNCPIRFSTVSDFIFCPILLNAYNENAFSNDQTNYLASYRRVPIGLIILTRCRTKSAQERLEE